MSAQRPSPRALFVLLVVSFLILNGLMLGCVPFRETAFAPLAGIARGEQYADSWRPLRRSFLYVSDQPEQARDLYHKMFFGASGLHKGLQYPPTALLPLYALRALGGDPWGRALEWSNWLFLALNVVLVVVLWRHAWGSQEGAPATGRAGIEAVLVAALCLAFFPLTVACHGGQIQTWLNALAAGSLLCWMVGRRAFAGVLVGMAALIKPQLGLLFLWALARRQWSFLLAGASTFLAGLGMSLYLLGPAPHVQYLGVLRFLSEHGESYFPNQSVCGMLHRLLRNGENLNWDPPGGPGGWMGHFPPYHPVVHIATMASSLVLVALAIFPPHPEQRRADVLDLARMALTATIASPVAWEHHYGVLAPVFVVLAPAVMRVSGPGPRLALLASYIVASNPFRIANRLADTPWNIAQSYLLGAGLVVLALLYWVQGRGRSRPRVGSPHEA